MVAFALVLGSPAGSEKEGEGNEHVRRIAGSSGGRVLTGVEQHAKYACTCDHEH